MRINDKVTMKGYVVPSFVNIETGETVPWNGRHNTLSYDASRAVAGALGGDMSVIPNRIGLIFGPSGKTFPTTISRDQSWDTLKNDLSDSGMLCDVQVRPFSYSPTVAQISGSSGYGVTFHMHSDSSTKGVFNIISDPFGEGDTVYQAVLLNLTNGSYKILARVDLQASDGSYRTKPKNFEVALDWTVKFF